VDTEFEQRILMARLRWLLTNEGKSIVRRFESEGALTLTVGDIAPMLMLAVAKSQPRSRLVPWHLSNAVVERMVQVVAESLITECAQEAAA
jgi:hypothetical protein